MVRLFLAINFPDEVRREAYEAAQPLRAAAPDVSWTEPSRLHLTLKFLGEQPPEAAARLEDALRRVATRHLAMPIALGEVGAFPNPRRPRVVWLGVHGGPKLELLHHDVEEACAALGYDLEGRAFRPHVTLGRVRPGAEPAALRELARAARRVNYRAELCVETLDVMQSQLSPAGARYTVLASAPLRAG